MLPSPTKSTVRLGVDSLMARQAPSVAPKIDDNRKPVQVLNMEHNFTKLTNSPSDTSPSHLRKQNRSLWKAHIDYSILGTAYDARLQSPRGNNEDRGRKK